MPTKFLVGYSGVIINEVHFAKDWSIHIKAPYDDFANHTLWISYSSSLCLRTVKDDLSRRFVHIGMPLISFLQILTLETGTEFPVYDPFKPSEKLPLKPFSLDFFRANFLGHPEGFEGRLYRPYPEGQTAETRKPKSLRCAFFPFQSTACIENPPYSLGAIG